MGPVSGSLLRWIYMFDIIQQDHGVNSKEHAVYRQKDTQT